MNLNELRDKAYETAKAKGFYDAGVPSIADYCANIHGEVSELWEAYRHSQLDNPCDKTAAMTFCGCAQLTCMEEELADIIIRALDMAGAHDIDIAMAVENKLKFNAFREYRHGNKIA